MEAVKLVLPCPTEPVVPFADDLEHLTALEEQAVGRVVLAKAWASSSEPSPLDVPSAISPLFAGKYGDDKSVEEALRVLDESVAARRAAAKRAGVNLSFDRFVDAFGLDEFDREVVLLLFLKASSERFRKALEWLGRKDSSNDDGAMSMGDVLSILVRDSRERLRRRFVFSNDCTLTVERVVSMKLRKDDISRSEVSLSDWALRFLEGDSNRYGMAEEMVTREPGRVSLDQVVLPDALKESVVAAVSNFYARQSVCDAVGLDDSLGYGSGLTMLFHGGSGTGKTMLAHALAREFGRPLVSLDVARSMNDMYTGFEDPVHLHKVFREARLFGGIVFLDEADDLLEDGGGGSMLARNFLVEVEKARCVTILVSNQPYRMDPSLERRIALRVQFTAPDKSCRERIWRSLVPPGASLADDVDFSSLAERYKFSGGLIKNSVMLAVDTAVGRVGETGNPAVVLRQADLVSAAERQVGTVFDESPIDTLYPATISLADVPIDEKDRAILSRLALASERALVEGVGLNILLSSTNERSSAAAVEGLASQAGLTLRSYSLSTVLGSTEKGLRHPASQRRVSPLEFIFLPWQGTPSLRVIVDDEGMLGPLFEAKNDKAGSSSVTRFIRALDKSNDMTVVVVPRQIRPDRVPDVFHHTVHLAPPSVATRLDAWVRNFGEAADEEMLCRLAEEYPIHSAEIDLVARKAGLLDLVEGGEGIPTLATVERILKSKRGKGGRTLFGGG